MNPETKLIDHMVALARDADTHDESCDDSQDGCCISNRWYTVACLMNYLGLELSDLGHIAEAWMDLRCETQETDESDRILDAKEIGE